jgi:hypothetical protein
MSSNKEARSLIYYLIRRGWYDQLVRLCDSITQKKGKDPATLYWKAVGTGMSGNIGESVRQLEGFQGRRDMQYPISLALKYFHSRAERVDNDAIDALNSEIQVTLEITVCTNGASHSFFV